MSEDKKTASVSTFSNFEDGATYEISVKGYDEVATMVAKVGKPASVTITSKSDMQGGIMVYTNTPTDLTFTLFDEFGNDITNTATNGYIVYTVADATSADYYVSGNSVCIYKQGTEVAVNAEYHTGEIGSDGYEIVLKATGYFVAVDKEVDTIASVSVAPTLYGYGYSNNQVPLNDSNAVITLKIKTTVQNDSETSYLEDDKLTVLDATGNTSIRLRSSNPDILDIGRETDWSGAEVNQLKLFKEGTAAVLVEIVTNNNGVESSNVIAATYITVVAKRAVTSWNVPGSLTVGNQAPYNTESLSLTAKDQYGSNVNIHTLVSATRADGVDVMGSLSLSSLAANNYSTNKIAVNSSVADGMTFPANSNEIAVWVTAKITAGDTGNGIDNVTKEIRFCVTVKKPAGAEYYAVEGNGTSGNIARYYTSSTSDNAESLKSASFAVYTMSSNGVKVEQEAVQPKTSNAVSGAAVGALFYTVTHNNNDITGWTYLDGNTIKVDFSSTASAYMVDGTNGVNKNIVTYATDDYTLGAGTYVFTLYKVVADSTGNVLTYAYVTSSSASVTCDAGSYTFVKRTSESVGAGYDEIQVNPWGVWDAATIKAVRDCFLINDRSGNPATGMYSVSIVDAEDYVHVNSITFYESLAYEIDSDGDGTNDTTVNADLYAPYTVNIGVSLKK